MCENNEINQNPAENEEYDAPVCITLTDDTGNELPFEIVDMFDYENQNYAILLPYEDLENDEVVIMEVVESDNEQFDEYIAVTDDDLADKIFNEFRKRNEGLYDFED